MFPSLPILGTKNIPYRMQISIIKRKAEIIYALFLSGHARNISGHRFTISKDLFEGKR
jgi:hypothetical protein